MPLYVYVCSTCDVAVEERRHVDLADWPPVECPVCHGLCEREIALVNLHFDRNSPSHDSFSGSTTGLDDEENPDVINILHAPGCPCCNGRRRVS